MGAERGLGQRLLATGFDGLAAATAIKVLTALEALERPVDLLQAGAGRQAETLQHVLVFALGDLLGRIRRERIALVPQVGGH